MTNRQSPRVEGRVRESADGLRRRNSQEAKERLREAQSRVAQQAAAARAKTHTERRHDD